MFQESGPPSFPRALVIQRIWRNIGVADSYALVEIAIFALGPQVSNIQKCENDRSNDT